MGILERLKGDHKEREAIRKKFEFEDRVVSDIERKKMSHNEREMAAILKREKEQHLKEALRLHEMKRRDEELIRQRDFMRGNIQLWH